MFYGFDGRYSPHNHSRIIQNSSTNPKNHRKKNKNHPKIIPESSQNHLKVIAKSPPRGIITPLNWKQKIGLIIWLLLSWLSLFKRSAHSAVPTLVAWRFGGNEGLEGLERNRDWWSWTGKNAANLKQTLEQSYRELADILLEFWCIWIKIIEKSVLEGVWGVRSHRKCYQDKALHQKLRIGESQD